MKAWRQPSPYGELTVVVSADGVYEISLPGDDQPDDRKDEGRPGRGRDSSTTGSRAGGTSSTRARPR